MLISPPFLPPRGTQTEDQWLDAAMAVSPTGTGAFPVSSPLDWHGGRHLLAPMGERGIALPARAIADGTVVYVRKRTEADSPDEPLNYGAGYTSDGVVVIRHDTDIGIGANDQLTQVQFYSVYMHLHTIQANIKKDKAIYRKDEIGQAGHIYGVPNLMHFEICCDEANLEKLIGRKTGQLNTATNGRTDALFGDIYFHLPVGTPIFANKPLPQYVAATTQTPATPARRGQAAIPAERRALTPTHTTTLELVIGLHYAGGEGVATQRGDAVLTTYKLNGDTEGTALRESEAEYVLYTSAKTISEAYPSDARPSMSAVYELLRFGRVIGPDALTPADVPHWRQVSYPGGQGWVNLNAANVHKFSDADFPQWKGWKIIDDDTNGDSRCDSATVRQIIYNNGTACLAPTKQHAIDQIKNDKVQKKLAHTICKFPSEWEAATFDKRWNWLKTENDENPEPLNDKDYAELKAHGLALCFPLPALFTAQWCFDPKEFIRVFRKCGWLSLREMTQLLPRQSVAGGEIKWLSSSNRLSTPEPRNPMPPNLYRAINRAFRKYGMNQRLRQAHFLGQVFVETGALTLNTEGGDDNYFRTNYEVITETEAGADYDRAVSRRRTIATSGKWPTEVAPLGIVSNKITTRENYIIHRPAKVATKATELGNTQVGDGSRFRGRGLIQLTGRNAYASYGAFKGGVDYVTDPNPTLLAANAEVATDVSGKFWVSKHYHGLNINRHADTGTDDTATEAVTRAVNGGTTHIDFRRVYFHYALSILNDELVPADTRTLERQKENTK